MKYPTPANSNRNLKAISKLMDKVGYAADDRLAIVGQMLEGMDWTCDKIYEACENGERGRAFRELAKLKKQAAEFDSVTAILVR